MPACLPVVCLFVGLPGATFKLHDLTVEAAAAEAATLLK